MITRILGSMAVLAVLAGCQSPTGDPVSEEMFTYTPPAPAPGGLGAPAPITSAPIDAGPPVQGYDPALEMVEAGPSEQVIGGGAGGLMERLPDTCKLELYQQYRGLSAAEVNAAGLTVPYRLVGPTDIVTQEYNPMRVNFHTDPEGRIARIACG
ncbi:MAG: I78 family peptidase inhibitor [Tropicimonas sp.]|uniref:I78 family peptidase inhibitor n=1 Tax=Tropicimonas sp. TaxID=2067044 RepID=UPI003A867480